MTENKNVFGDYMAALRFIASNVSIYGAANRKLNDSDGDDGFLAFYSREFLRLRQWVVIPLWEGDLRSLQVEGASE